MWSDCCCFGVEIFTFFDLLRIIRKFENKYTLFRPPLLSVNDVISRVCPLLHLDFK
jgi:hypothetical protein